MLSKRCQEHLNFCSLLFSLNAKDLLSYLAISVILPVPWSRNKESESCDDVPFGPFMEQK